MLTVLTLLVADANSQLILANKGYWLYEIDGVVSTLWQIITYKTIYKIVFIIWYYTTNFMSSKFFDQFSKSSY